VLAHDLLVLARALPAAHDEGFKRSRELSRAFCSGVERAAASSPLDRRRLASLADELLSPSEWTGWHVSFGVVEEREGAVRAFNCGLVGVALHASSGTVSAMLDPQTVGRKLRRDGVTSVPAHVEHIGASLAGRGMSAGDIEETRIELAADATIVVTAEPRLVSLSELETPAPSIDALRDAIEKILASLINPTRAYALWSPHARHAP
jgi:hypothetical protein